MPATHLLDRPTLRPAFASPALCVPFAYSLPFNISSLLPLPPPVKPRMISGNYCFSPFNKPLRDMFVCLYMYVKVVIYVVDVYYAFVC